MRPIAVALGLLAALCALAFPFLPVVQDTAEIAWPTGSDTRSVNAPLTGYWAQDLEAELPCPAIRSLDARTNGPALLFATVPDGRTDPRAGKGVGLQLRVDNGVLLASSQGQQLVQQPLPQTGCTVTLSSEASQLTLAVAGTTVFHTTGDVRPRVIGIYSSISSARDPIAGLHVSVVPDTRYQTSPTAVKLGVGILAVLAFLGCLVVVWRMDSGFARRAPRWAPVGWWRLTGRDAAVILTLGAWVFIGPVTSDDGYILTMSRVTEQTGFLTNYHRWFGVAEAPFGWFYHVYELMAHVSVVPPWIRLPSYLLGVISWLLISREVMPRLGPQVRGSRAAGWAAAAVFLVWWMPYNNGVRPEPVAALGSLLAICAVERALVTRRLLPLCLGLTAAAFTLAATPTGLIAVAPFLVAARPLFKLIRQRAAEGWLPVLAPILAAGLLVLVVVFADQTFATVQEATRIRTQVGPNLSWFQELVRYQLLFENLPDGSAPRRFPVLLVLLCTGTCLVVLLRRGRIPGAALGPSRRLIGTVALFFLLLALTPTKWTHHFGAFAAVGASMAALTALATSSTVLRSNRNRAAFLAGLLVVGALAATGPNTYWFVSRLGVPWTNVAPSLAGVPLSTILLAAAAIAGVYAFVENIRAHRPGASAHPPEGRSRSLRLGSLSLVVVCGLAAAGEFYTMAMAMHTQSGSYSLGAADFGHLLGHSCNLSDHVMVEQDPAKSMLHAQSEQRTVPAEPEDPPSPLPDPNPGNGRVQTGFHTAPADDKDPLAEPPHGFTPATVPMWSSYLDPQTRAGRLRSDWYALTEKPANGQIVVSAAAQVRRPSSVSLDYGVNTPAGVKILRSQFALPPGAGTGGWGDTRINLRDLPPQTDAVRIDIVDDDLTEDGWIAASAPRVPKFTTLTDKLAGKSVYIDWPASFVYPCAQPVTSHDGISQVPDYRITAGSLADEADWASSTNGGPNGWLEELADEPEVPSYLIGQPSQSWGQLLQVEPFTEGIAPTVRRGTETVWGWWSPGPGPKQPNGKDPTR
ncbi:arabinosyltransferase domain-containing protein [Amycolatopsis sp. PS_44_ISF1]|uniref:arabinosyltransferase domain-containing protein n=1 Tax=Amycolatopsis sp. PS_44_ISF1 TaxID=2974917 RepID=UPI0028E00C3F|nr:arabinosyltransferase domain-containing protein [Amycolatopsis sp. PS_44_ISF1]MDT8912121.1 arabinosyltransferase domain-containing protein [Amycolatopsis sp. PS_44_ISF1]